MTDERRFRGLAERIEEHLVDEDGNGAPSEVVATVVGDKAADLEDAPVPLLVENQTRDELRRRGLKVDWSAYEAEGGADEPSG
jgi:hypothetical protein